MSRFVFHAESEEATATFGAALADVLPDGTTLALCGTLGAGKTRLVQAIAAALGIDRRDVLSPTFVLIQEYHGRRTLYHCDAYRLRDAAEFLALGAEEFFDAEGLLVIEWADRIAEGLPRQRVEVHIEVTGPESRQFEVLPVGPEFVGIEDALRQRLSGDNRHHTV